MSKFTRGKIEDRKEWKTITDKDAPSCVVNIWDNVKLTPSQIKFLANVVEYNLDDIEDRWNHYINLPLGVRKGNSLEMYILKYGEDVGLLKFENKNQKSAVTLKNMIRRHGVTKGTLKYEKCMNKRRNLENTFIEKYGEGEGSRRYSKFCERNKGNHTLERQIELYGIVEGTKRHHINRKKLKDLNTLDGFIDRYGEDIGLQKYHNRMEKMWSCGKIGYSKISQELFQNLEEEYPDSRFALNGGEVKVGPYSVDFEVCGKIIEFYGDKMHANPKIFKDDDTPNPFEISRTSRDIWEYDRQRILFLEHCGYNVKIIWEKDYRDDEVLVIDECLKFLRDE